MGYDSIWHWLIVAPIFLLVGVVVYIVPLWRITQKAGFPGVLSLLMLVPVLNLVLLWVFAFIKWPVERTDV